MGRLPGADHGDSVFVLRSELALHIEDEGRIINLAEQFGILLIVLCENVATKFLDALEFACEIDRALPRCNGFGDIDADAMDLHEFSARSVQNGRGIAEILEQLPNPNGPDVLDHVQCD